MILHDESGTPFAKRSSKDCPDVSNEPPFPVRPRAAPHLRQGWNSTCKGEVMVKQVPLERNWCSELVSLVHMNHGSAETIPGNLEEIGERTALVLTESR